MPIYEYQTIRPASACPYCRNRFEVLQKVSEKPLDACPRCKGPVKKVISWCRAAIHEESPENVQVTQQVKDYEASGMWSHAAELADKHSEKTKDKSLKLRALDNYQKAGYDTDTLARHAKT